MKLNKRSFRGNTSRRSANAASWTPWTASGVAMLTLIGGGASLLTGCGSGHGVSSVSAPSGTSVAAEKGRATISIVWPTRAASGAVTSRLIPLATNSIVVVFVQNGTIIAQQTLARPTTGSTTTATFTGLTPGAYSVLATAFASGDGSGVGLAGATTSTTIVSAQTTTVGISLVSQVDHLTAALSSATFPVASVNVNDLTYSAVDASDNLLPLSASALTFTSSNTAIATVDASGTIVGVGAGTANIIVTDTESGKSGSVPANVVLDYAYLPPTTVVNGQRVTYHTTADGLEFYDLQAGSGAFPLPGQTVTITYVGSLVDGTVFDASSRHSPGTLSFPSQKGAVISGFDEAVAGMQVGTVRRVAIPSNLAYGPNGAQGIPPNATLIFDLKLISIQ